MINFLLRLITKIAVIIVVIWGVLWLAIAIVQDSAIEKYNDAFVTHEIVKDEVVDGIRILHEQYCSRDGKNCKSYKSITKDGITQYFIRSSNHVWTFGEFYNSKSKMDALIEKNQKMVDPLSPQHKQEIDDGISNYK